MYVKKFRLVTTGLVPATIPDKTTRESFPHHAHFPKSMQQNYFQNDTFAERKPCGTTGNVLRCFVGSLRF